MPSHAEILTAHGQSLKADIHTGIPAKVILYDPLTNTLACEVAVKEPLFLADGDREYTALPTLLNVPVQWPRFGGKVIRGMIDPGDWVWLAFSEASLAEWRSTGQTSSPVDARRLSIGYPFATPGAFPDCEPLTPADALEIAAGAMIIGEDGGPNRIVIGGLPLGNHVMTVEACALLIYNTLVALMAAAGGGPLLAAVLQPLLGTAVNAALAAQAVPAPVGEVAQAAAATALLPSFATGTVPANTSAFFTAAIAAGLSGKTENVTGLFPSLGAKDVKTG